MVVKVSERIYVIDVEGFAGGVVDCCVVKVSFGDNGSQESSGI